MLTDEEKKKQETDNDAEIIPEKEHTPEEFGYTGQHKANALRYDAMLDAIDKELAQQKQKDKAETRRQGYRDLINAIGDATIGLSDIIAANKYAPHVASKSLSEQGQKRAEKLKAERQKDYDKMLAYYNRTMQQRDKALNSDTAERKNAEAAMYKAEQMDLQNRRYYLDVRRQDWREKYQQGTLDLKAEQQKIDKDFKDKKISIATRNAATSELRAYKQRDNNKDYTETNVKEKTDEMGNKTTETSTKQRVSGTPKQSLPKTNGKRQLPKAH